MPIHDWTRVDAGIFHAFHHSWIEENARALNRGLLPPDYYALPEQIAGKRGPDVPTLQMPGDNGRGSSKGGTGGAVSVAIAEPHVRFRMPAEVDAYSRKAKAVTIRHISDHAVVAVIEIVSPGNKASRQALQAFVTKSLDLLQARVHLLIVDLLPPGPRDPHGLHDVLWQEFTGVAFTPPADLPLTLASYRAGEVVEAFVEPTAVGKALIDMPVFLTPDEYVPLPLEKTYLAAWEAVPAFWRGVVEGTRAEA